jgi:hypothetical protein
VTNSFVLLPDINECTQGTHNCPAFSTCQNTDGSFICLCGTGLGLLNGQCVGKKHELYDGNNGMFVVATSDGTFLLKYFL